MTVTKTELARRLGVHPQAVAKAVHAGRLDRSRHGNRFDFDVALREWNANRGTTPDGTTAALRRRFLEVKNATAELEYAIKAGRYIEREPTLAAWAAEIVRTRTQLEGLPSRMKAQLPHLTTADLVVMQALIADVLNELSTFDEEKGAA